MYFFAECMCVHLRRRWFTRGRRFALLLRILLEAVGCTNPPPGLLGRARLHQVVSEKKNISSFRFFARRY